MQRLATLAAVICALATPALAELKTGTKAPDFTAQGYLAGQAFTFKLSDALKKGPVVMYFFPAAYTAGCNIETHMFSEASAQFAAAKATLIGVTAGNPERLKEYSADTQYCAGKFALLADPGAKIAKQYDTTLVVDPAQLPPGTVVPKGLSGRTSYVLAPSGKVLHAYDALKPQEHVTETLAAPKAWRAKGK